MKKRPVMAHYLKKTFVWLPIWSILFLYKQDGNEKFSLVILLSGSQWSVWPDLAKFRYFTSWQVFGIFLVVYLLFGKLMSLLWQICDIIGLIFIVANGPKLKNNLTIWSHCRGWWRGGWLLHQALGAFRDLINFNAIQCDQMLELKVT